MPLFFGVQNWRLFLVYLLFFVIALLLTLNFVPENGFGHFAIAMLETIGRQPALGGRRLELRIGIHCEPATAGVIGDTRFSYDVWGDAVNTASRVESNVVPGQVHVSDSFRELAAGSSSLRNAVPSTSKASERCVHSFWSDRFRS
jgi:class 3 adenylate cyclase